MTRNRLAVIFLVVFVDLVGFGMILPLLPFYAQSFGANAELVGLLATAYAAAQFVGAPVLGRVSDRAGFTVNVKCGLRLRATDQLQALCKELIGRHHRIAGRRIGDPQHLVDVTAAVLTRFVPPIGQAAGDRDVADAKTRTIGIVRNNERSVACPEEIWTARP